MLFLFYHTFYLKNISHAVKLRFQTILRLKRGELMRRGLMLFSLILLILMVIFILTETLNTGGTSKEAQLFALGYRVEDQILLKQRFSDDAIQQIIKNHIHKDRLFPYLVHPYFNLHRLNQYEKARETLQLSPFASINYTHLPIALHFTKEDDPSPLPAPFKQTPLVLVNKQFYLESDFEPTDLVYLKDINVVVPGLHERNQLKREAYIALKALFQEAERQGLSLYVLSGYRSYHRQQVIYDQLIEANDDNRMISAKPGHSEHQTGLSVDITTPAINYRLTPDFEKTPEGSFILNYAHRFGFIIRYPKDKECITGYLYEPWHLRYVGKEIAQFIHDHRLTLEEYILYYVPIPESGY